MDSINIIDPSYGNPTDGTGSLVSNQIKFKKESRNNIEKAASQFRKLSRENIVEHVENKMIEMPDEEIDQNIAAMESKAEEAREEIVNAISETPRENMDETFNKTIKEKSDYAKRMEERIKALGALDADEYVSTLKPIPFGAAKPLKIKPGNYSIVHENGNKFSTMIEAPVNEAEEVVEQENFADNSENVDNVVEEAPIIPMDQDDNVIQEQENVVNETGFKPEAAEMDLVSGMPEREEQVESMTNEDIDKKPLTEADIREEIDKILEQTDKKSQGEVTDIDNMVSEEVEEEAIPETVTWEEPVVEEKDNSRDLPEIVPERETAIIPVMTSEEEKEEEQELHYDYSDITEKDVKNTNSIAILEEMKKAKEKKIREKREAEANAEKEEKALVVSKEEASKLRKRAEESEKSVQAKMEEFQRFIDSYDEEINRANERREKAASDKAQTDEEIAKYQASIESNADIEKELESMMEVDEEEKVTKKGK